MAAISKWNLAKIKNDCISSYLQCSKRGLLQSAKWAAELSYSIDNLSSSDTQEPPTCPQSQEFALDSDRYMLAKSYFDLKEYDRASHFVSGCNSPEAYFLHMYARFLSGEKKKLDDAPDSIGPQETDNEYLKTLRGELHKKHKAKLLDAFGLYLYGAILKKLDLLEEARAMYLLALHANPLIWSAWLELSLLITNKELLAEIHVPEHWIAPIFSAHTYLELHMNEEALNIYKDISNAGLERSTYLMSQIALAHYHNFKEVDQSVEAFNKLQNVDPYRLEHMDIYSNLLYVKEMRRELAHLAHHCSNIDKYRDETCCVIGNYYSLRSQHEKAVLYFLRALKLNPNYLSAWTLMGHEYMELKNTSGAIQAYRKAIEVNRRDYRAWYGLGQTYEILKMPQYCLYYYREAQSLRPQDSRMVVALGDAYEKLDRLQEAKKCFVKAHAVGDVEGQALIKLAKLYEKLGEEQQAVAAYTEFINETDQQGVFIEEQSQARSQAYRYLANFHLTHRNMDEAYYAAQECAKYNETREEGKALLRQISQLRAVGATDPMGVETNDSGSIRTDRVQRAFETSQGTPNLQPINLTFTP